jgi:peptidoglycan/LPS O-acetylase OafA/YrhL
VSPGSERAPAGATAPRLLYVPAFDGLRAVAVLAVMMFHAQPGWLPGGFLGVDIFFVLSGYLITRLLLVEYGAHGRIAWGRFYRRRARRLVPALMLMLVAYCAWMSLVPGVDMAAHVGEALLAFLYVSNWVRAFDAHALYYLGHTWSLAVEAQFYLLWPLLVLWVLRRNAAPTSLAAWAAVLALASWGARLGLLWSGAPLERMYNGLDSHADGLMAGALLATGWSGASRWWEQLPAWVRRAMLATAVALLGALIARADWTSPWMSGLGYVAVSLTVVLLLLALGSAQPSLLGRVLSMRLLVWIGTISYGLYLWHFPVLRVLRDWELGDWTIVLAGFALTFALAAASYRFVERPLLRRRGGVRAERMRVKG